MLAVICTPFSDRRFLREMTFFHQYLWFLDHWQPFWPTLGLIRISAGVIKGDLRMFSNPVAHENLVGSLREVYSLLDSWAPLQTHCIRISRVRPGKLFQNCNWGTDSLALTAAWIWGASALGGARSLPVRQGSQTRKWTAQQEVSAGLMSETSSVVTAAPHYSDHCLSSPPVGSPISAFKRTT